jgi:Tfp pilus assembly protein PilF
LLLAVALANGVRARDRLYELTGRILPATSAAVSLFGATTPFSAATLADGQGRFRFRALAPGQYTVAVLIAGRGEVRKTVDVGPGTADRNRRLAIVVGVPDSEVSGQDVLRDQSTVSARELSIPEAARREYREAQKKLSHRDAPAAVAHLERAVESAPQFSAAWNTLGTIAYQSHQYERAERCFREALDRDMYSFEALVNLGGVLLTEQRIDDALSYNLLAVSARPKDALANSQLGLNYFEVDNLDLAQKYLEIAKGIDPAHFSYPQLTLAEIHLRRHEPSAAAREFRDFLQQHPDAAQGSKVRDQLAKLEY